MRPVDYRTRIELSFSMPFYYSRFRMRILATLCAYVKFGRSFFSSCLKRRLQISFYPLVNSETESCLRRIEFVCKHFFFLS